MTAELRLTDDILRKKVLIEINEDLRQGFNVMMLLDSNLPGELIKAMTESDEEIRELASRTMI
jgi:hypothetical protein